MRTTALTRPGTYITALIVVMFAIVAQPTANEVRGMAGYVTEHPGIVSNIDSSQIYDAEDNGYTSYETYTFHDGQTGRDYVSSDVAGDSKLQHNQPVRLGIVNGELVSVDGELVRQMGFFDRILFGMMCALLGMSIALAAYSRKFDKAEASVGRAILATCILLLPAVIAGFLTAGLSLVAEINGFAWWPVAELLFAVSVGLLVAARARAKRVQRP